MLASRVASSLDKATIEIKISCARLEALVHLCGASEFFGEMLASNPPLILALPLSEAEATKRDYDALLRAATESANGFGARVAALRREWAKLIVEIGALDASGAISMFEANARQTDLAAASLDAGCLISSRELARRYGEDEGSARVAQQTFRDRSQPPVPPSREEGARRDLLRDRCGTEGRQGSIRRGIRRSGAEPAPPL